MSAEAIQRVNVGPLDMNHQQFIDSFNEENWCMGILIRNHDALGFEAGAHIEYLLKSSKANGCDLIRSGPGRQPYYANNTWFRILSPLEQLGEVAE